MNAKQKRTTRVCLIVALILLINVAVALLPFRVMHPDVSGNGVYTLSDSTKRLLKTIDRDAEIVYYASSPDADLRSFLSLYQTAHVRVRVAEPTTDEADQTILVQCGSRSRTLDLEDLYYYVSDVSGELLSLTEYAQLAAAYSQLSSDSEQYQAWLYYYGPDAIQTRFIGDETISAALRNLTVGETETVYVLVGTVGSTADWYISLRLEQYGFLTETVSSLSEVPSGATVWLAPEKDLSEEQAGELRGFLSEGGRLFLTTVCTTTNLPNLAAILEEYGMSTAPVFNVVGDTSSSSTLSQEFNAKKPDHAINEMVSGSVAVSYAHAIKLTETEGVSSADLLRTSLSGAYVEQDGEETKTESGCFSVAVSAVKGESRVVWIGMPLSALTDSGAGGIGTYAAACFSWLGGADALQSTVGEAREIPSSLLNVKVTSFFTWIVIFVLLIPAALLATALIRRYIREKKG